MAKETKYLFKPFQGRIMVNNGEDYCNRIFIGNSQYADEACKIMVNSQLQYENHHSFRWGTNENVGSEENGMHKGICNVCGDYQLQKHTWDKTPKPYSSSQHRYYCTKLDSRGIQCSGYYDENHGDNNLSYENKKTNHTVKCKVCEGSWPESHNLDYDWGPGYDVDGTFMTDKHVCYCTKCGNPEWEYHSRHYYETSKPEETHEVWCDICLERWDEDHDEKSYFKENNSTHTVKCGVCQQTWPEDHDEKSYSGGNNASTHTVKCGICKGTWDEDHSWGEWSNNENGLKGTHQRKCSEPGCYYNENYQTETHVFDKYKKYGNLFVATCTTSNCDGKHPISKWSIEYPSVPCGNDKTCTIWVKYDGDGQYRLKTNASYIVFTGDSQRPSDDIIKRSGGIYLFDNNGWWYNNNGWELSGKRYHYIKHFGIKNDYVTGSKWAFEEGYHEPSFFYCSNYLTILGGYSEWSYYSNSPSSYSEEKELRARSGTFYFKGGSTGGIMGGVYICSNKASPYPYVIVKSDSHWHIGGIVEEDDYIKF